MNKLIDLLANYGPGNAIIIGMVLLFCSIPTVSAADKQIIGRVERVTLNNTDFAIYAKIDTGAKNSSLNATNYKFIQKNNEKWLEFNVTNRDGETIKLSKKFKRFTKIKRKGAEKQKRPVIELDICLGTVKKRVEVNLVNRSNFNYQMLIGVTFMKGDFIVDVENELTVEPRCR